MDKKPLIVLTGPTAVGKTTLSIRLAKSANAEIISADSMQVYKHMDIGTAKINSNEMEGIPHYLIDEFEPDEEFNVVRFQKYAKKYIKSIHERGKIPLLVGGTGFYIQAVLNDIDFTNNIDNSNYRKKLELLADKKGKDYIYNMLKRIDMESAKNIHPNNIKRVIRALEYHELTGLKISTHNKEQRKRESPYNFCYFVLTKDRTRLYKSIDKRVDLMLDKGLIDEVKSLQDIGYTKDMVSMQGLGYKEILSYLNGETTLNEAVEILKRDTRHYAKRQLTWFKRERDVTWINKDEFIDDNQILDHILCVLKNHNIVN